MSININMKQDYSFLFSSLGGNNSGAGLSSLLSDYASIKNGSYGKLMKAYYAETGKDEVRDLAKSISSKQYGRTSNKVTSEEAKALSNMQSSTDGLKESADKLLEKGSKSVFAKKDITTKDENGVETTRKGYDTGAIYSAVNDFVKDYNAVVKAAGNVDNKSISNRLGYMTHNTSVNSKSLNKLGITVNSDNTLALDKETFMKADMNTAKTLFNGTGSYGYGVSAQAGMMNYTADYEANRASTYTNTGAFGNNYYMGNIYNGYF